MLDIPNLDIFISNIAAKFVLSLKESGKVSHENVGQYYCLESDGRFGSR